MLKLKNGDSPDVITFNGQDVLTLVYNGEIVWQKNTASETWILNNTLTSNGFDQAIDFKSDGVIFNSMKYAVNNLTYDDIVAYNEGTWSNEGYKTVIFTTAPTGVLRTWLQTNATLKTESN